MHKVQYLKTDPATFQRDISHISIKGQKAELMVHSGMTYPLERRVDHVRCNLLEFDHRVKIRLDDESGPEMETLECKVYFTGTVIVGDDRMFGQTRMHPIWLAHTALTFARTQEPDLGDRNFFRAKMLEFTDEERLKFPVKSEVYAKRLRSNPAGFGEKDKAGFPCFPFPADPDGTKVQLKASVFDAIIRQLAAYQDNALLQAWVEIEAYFGDCGVILVPASAFQFARIKHFIGGNFAPYRLAKPLGRIPADYMYSF